MPEVMVLDDATIAKLARSLAERAAAVGVRRWVVGIAGVPGAGKSTLAERLCAALGPGAAAVVAMDGFHRSDAALRRAGLLERKGSPETFDAAGYVALLRRCRAGEVVARVPVYDRALHEPRLSDAPGHAVTSRTRVVIAEGNYLLLERPPWAALAEVLDEAWWLDVPEEQAERWLIDRHVRTGRSHEQAERKRELDRANAALVRTASRRAGLVLRWPG